MAYTPKIGIAVPAYNAKKYLERCLTTLRAQTYPVSIYVVDDASDDGTYEFLRDRPSWYTSMDYGLKRMGWPTALNCAVQMAIDDGCDAVFLMNADDFLRLDCIEKCVEALEGNDWGQCYGQDVGGDDVVRIPLKENVVYEDLFGEYAPLVPGFVTAKAWTAVGGFSTDVTVPGSYGYAEDWDFLLKLYEAGYDKYEIVREPVYYYVHHGEQLSNTGFIYHDEARKRIMEKHNHAVPRI